MRTPPSGRRSLRPHRKAVDERLAKLEDLHVWPEEIRPEPAPPLVMEPGESRYQRRSAHLKDRIVDSQDEGGPTVITVELPEFEAADDSAPR
jgi:hypothetical protein